MNGTKSLSSRTVFPLLSLPVELKAGTSKSKRHQSIGIVVEPLYATEQAVTEALINKTFVGFAPTAYADAKRYQLYLKLSRKNR